MDELECKQLKNLLDSKELELQAIKEENALLKKALEDISGILTKADDFRELHKNVLQISNSNSRKTVNAKSLLKKYSDLKYD